MEPLTAATAFATIVGLLRIFRQEQGERERLNHQKFIEWVEYHRHEELKNLIVNNAALRAEVDNLLQADHAQMLGKLDRIEEILVSLVSRVDGLRDLALAVAPNTTLSEQAISILRQFVESGATQLIYGNHGGGSYYLNFVGGAGKHKVAEWRLLTDDLNQLVALQLLSVAEHKSDGTKSSTVYCITRCAIRFLEAVGDKPRS
jgi:hypothetical protein